jgi:hypothetical protein
MKHARKKLTKLYNRLLLAAFGAAIALVGFLRMLGGQQVLTHWTDSPCFHGAW